MSLIKIVLLVSLTFLVTSCAERETLAPVSDIHWEKAVHHQTYRAKAGDTLYSIAWRYGLDYKALAQFNHISKPYVLDVGTTLKIPTSRETSKLTKTIYKKKREESAVNQPLKKNRKAIKKHRHLHTKWVFPAQGDIKHRFNLSRANKGVEIRGKYRSPIVAARSGVVAYSGNGLDGYGNLIIIKHNSTYLSAYAFNSKNIVKEGKRVKAGEKIAEMGRRKGSPLLHFEIRQNGKPVNPMRLVRKR